LQTCDDAAPFSTAVEVRATALSQLVAARRQSGLQVSLLPAHELLGARPDTSRDGSTYGAGPSSDEGQLDLGAGEAALIDLLGMHFTRAVAAT